MQALILAGGLGSRLRPYTTNFPKPLMPIGHKPILEIIIERLRDAGIREIIILTGYLEELIKAYFQGGEKFKVNIKYSREDKPLGTAGPLNLVRDYISESFLVMNGDVLTDLDFRKLFEYHISHGSDATIASSKRTVCIDFGVIELDNLKEFTNWSEKPTIEYLVSTGIYLFEPIVFESLPTSGFFNLPDLILKLKKEKRKVMGYIHDGYWLDIGRPEDYEKACQDFGNNSI